eukprot:11532736-Alexandrium_andersonii.AAC.1
MAAQAQSRRRTLRPDAGQEKSPSKTPDAPCSSTAVAAAHGAAGAFRGRSGRAVAPPPAHAP